MTHLSLFTGIGGIDLAAEWAGFETVAMVERDKFCQQVLAKNFEGVKIHDDVTTFNGLEYRGVIDIVSAGFPCQPHSVAGLRKASGDERDLWGEVVRILRETEPAWFLGENVPGLFTSERGQFFGRIINGLESLGYSVGWGCYGAKDVGAVHKRDRVFIVAYANSKRCQEQWGNISNESKHNPIKHGAYQSIKTGDWRQWEINPTVRLESRVCGSNDGVPNRVDRLKALGNAVVPQQVYPILVEIAKHLQTFDNQA